MTSEASYLTPEGAARLKSELAELTGPRRLALSERLRAAIQQGDLSENADYHAAKEEQAFLEGRIQTIQRLLDTSTIIADGGAASDRVSVGNRVTIQTSGQAPEVYVIVGATEARPREGKISNVSPIGKALLGRMVGDTVTVETPAGDLRFTILELH